jgi:ADP-ribose pyrophosphatase
MNYYSLIDRFPRLFSNEGALFRIITNDVQIKNWQDTHRIQLRGNNQPEEWADIGIVFNDPYVVILRDLIEFPSGYLNGYIRLYDHAYLNGNVAVAILSEKDGNLLLIKHYRHATRGFHWEIPRGYGAPGIDSASQAKNEIYEEIGGDISEIFDLGFIFPNTGLEGSPVNIFFAKLNSIGDREIEEGIQNLIWVSVSELEQMIADEEITDGFTIAAYTRAKLKGLI